MINNFMKLLCVYITFVRQSCRRRLSVFKTLSTVDVLVLTFIRPCQPYCLCGFNLLPKLQTQLSSLSGIQTRSSSLPIWSSSLQIKTNRVPPWELITSLKMNLEINGTHQKKERLVCMSNFKAFSTTVCKYKFKSKFEIVLSKDENSRKGIYMLEQEYLFF